MHAGKSVIWYEHTYVCAILHDMRMRNNLPLNIIHFWSNLNITVSVLIAFYALMYMCVYVYTRNCLTLASVFLCSCLENTDKSISWSFGGEFYWCLWFGVLKIFLISQLLFCCTCSTHGSICDNLKIRLKKSTVFLQNHLNSLSTNYKVIYLRR